MNTIGNLSRCTGVNIETIRYYERIKLIPAPPRTESGRRLYSPNDRRRLAFIRHAREIGFDIPTIRVLLDLQEVPENSCWTVTKIARTQLAAVESRIERLLVLKHELTRMILECSNGKVANCRIVEALTDPGARPNPTSRSIPKKIRLPPKKKTAQHRKTL